MKRHLGLAALALLLGGCKDPTLVDRAESLGPEHSQAACAYSLARLARERPIS